MPMLQSELKKLLSFKYFHVLIQVYVTVPLLVPNT